MHLKDAIKLRRSIRSFQNSDVSSDVIEHILSLAIEAPSAGNLQPWRIIILSKKEDKKEVAKIAYNQNFITQAPFAIIIAADTKKCMSVYGVRGRDLYSIQDTSALIENILLIATDCGLGTCWVGAFDEKALAEFLDLPDGIRPVAIIPIGYPAENPPNRGRTPLKDILTWF